MIRSVKHSLSNSNPTKLSSLDTLFVDYKHDLAIYINYIIDGVLPLKPLLSSVLLPNERISHSQYKQVIYKQSSEIIRSQIDKAKTRRYNKYRQIYSYYLKNKSDSKFNSLKFSELNLKPILQSKWFTKPILNNISINLDSRLFNIHHDAKHFDGFIRIILPTFNESGTRALQIRLPFKEHKHSLGFRFNTWQLRNTIQLKRIKGYYYLTQIWNKEVEKRTMGKAIAFDMGYKKLLVSNENYNIGANEMQEIYSKISRKTQGSNAFKRSLVHRDNEINRLCNTIDTNELSHIILEDLKDVKSGKKYFTNKIQRWSYAKCVTKIGSLCEVNGITLVKVSPAYTSQTCSSCGHVDKTSRQGEWFCCTRCEYELDADHNAAVNIHKRGIYSFSDQKSKCHHVALN
jgi:IS605 OrfB family transposase